MPTHRSQALVTLLFRVSQRVSVLLSGDFRCPRGSNNSDAWLITGSLASFHLRCAALLQSVLTALHQRKQNVKVRGTLTFCLCGAGRALMRCQPFYVAALSSDSH